MSPAEIDPASRCRIPLIRREELDADGQKAFDFYTSGTMRGLHGPAGIWLHSPKLAELYRSHGTYLRSASALAKCHRPARDDTGVTHPESPASLWNPRGYGNSAWAHITVSAI